MNQVKVIHSYAKLADADFETKAAHILESMTGNANFPAPAPPLTDLQNALTAYGDALAKASDGSKEDTAAKNNQRLLLAQVLSSLADYVQATAAGNDATALSSGFDLAKAHAHVGLLPKPANAVVIPGPNKGSMEVSADTVPDADFYEYQFTDAPAIAGSVWQTQTAKKKKHVIEGLTSGKAYVFRMAGAGSDPGRVWSDEITSFVL